MGVDKKNVQVNALIWLWLSFAVVVLDQLSKLIIVHLLVRGDSIVVLPFLNLTLVYNTGAAFSFLGNLGGAQVYFLTAISLIVIIVMTLWMRSIPRNSYLLAVGFACIVGGAIGNVIDRIALSHVIDFIDFHLGSWHFATFNIADSAITIGAVLLVVHFLFDQAD